ncbi:hypothetical protein CHS0354_020256 [Potamilus streckersoni]|uniref:Nudix hydrolase domain-containing protein n=1 Tax=Potamilus streckersoni TaxID=2493646 RepID=A0AAE0VPZ3_9BIVA|nr:hypothetical protein CHS0354_020256 [Potamilus streckersoni]
MAGIAKVIKKLLHGQAVVIRNVDVNLNKDLKACYVPITKQTICYIVMAVVIDDEGKVLFIQEAKRSCYGKWYLPAGRMESGENIVDGVKREVLEESGLEFEPITLICVEINSAMWHRFIFTGKVTGGKLKTVLEKDTESLQAQWFTPQQIKDHEMPLRVIDILRPIKIGVKHHSSKGTHPNCLPAIAPHKLLIHRPLIVKEKQDGTIDVLVYKDQEPHIPSCVIDSRDYSPLLVSVFNILKVVIIFMYNIQLFLKNNRIHT